MRRLRALMRKEFIMRQASKRFVAVIVTAVVVMVVVTGVIFIMQVSGASGSQTVSGTIEVNEIHLGTMLGGKVSTVNVEEGASVQQGEVLATVQSAASVSTGTEEQIRAPIDAVEFLSGLPGIVQAHLHGDQAQVIATAEWTPESLSDRLSS
jgi:multidrug efflux pump subunit AcrA (membrane-fusion protein)